MTTRHPIAWLAQCHTCGKEWATRHAIRCAAAHAKRTGHLVMAEVTISYTCHRRPAPKGVHQ